MTSAAILVGVFAFLDDGVPTADVHLNDAGVWLTNQSLLMVGHLNHASSVLDVGYSTTGNNFDVAQDGSRVVVHDLAGNTLSPLDPASVSSLAAVALPVGAAFGLGGDVGAVLDPADGRLWIISFGELPGATFDGREPDATVGADATLAVGRDGVVTAASSQTGDVVTLSRDGRGVLQSHSDHLALAPDASLTITRVGDSWVALDRESHTLYLSDGSVDVPEGSRLQQPSGAANYVAVAAPDALWRQPLDGSAATVTAVTGSGLPAAPVSLDGCVYSAWAGSGQYVRACTDSSFDEAIAIDGALPSAAFVFRVNHGYVVLNDYLSGTGWLANDGMEKVDQWEALMPPAKDQLDDLQYEEDDESSLPKRSDTNTPPVAADDAFGARPGRTTVLPIVDNDYDMDGDVLTAVVVDSTSTPGDVQSIRGGAAFQVVLAEGATGTGQFTYRVSDGRGGIDDATVNVTIVPDAVNTAPTPRRHSRMNLEAGATVGYNVLPDWIDPEGDTIFLKAVESNGIDQVDFTPDGHINVTANADVPGSRDIAITVSDGDQDGIGALRLNVMAEGTLAPLTNPDHVVTIVNQPITVSPLGNDASRSAAPLRLALAEPIPGPSIVPDYDAGTFTFTSASAGTFYVPYLVTDGVSNGNNLVRIDVLAEVDSSLPPIAVSDVALVAPGGTVLVDVLANDTDPGGNVLVVQNVDVPPTSDLQVEVLEHHLLRMTDPGGMNEPVTLSYLVSNGTQTARAEVTVLPILPPTTILAPVAEDDTVLVRAGDVATIDVLANDWHPSGASIDLAGLVEPLVVPASAKVFTSDGKIRVFAGHTAGNLTATYDVVDEYGQRGTAQLRIKIVGADEGNSAPRPVSVTARVLAGNNVRIPIVLSGIDPDGDSVTLEGVGSSPTLGRVVQVGEDWLVYEAFADSRGTDSFEYVVRDRLGAVASGAVVVGVVPSVGLNNRPIAVRDEATTRPGHVLSVPVLVNDTDPDSDLISLSTMLTVPEGLTGEVRDDRIVVSTDVIGEYTVLYTVQDVYGAAAVGTLVVTVDPDVPPVPPIARDDTVKGRDVADDGTVSVDVLANDEDPDGSASALVVSMDPADGVVGEGGLVALAAIDVPRVVTYTITDPDGLTASAFILVPGYGTSRPYAASTTPIEVMSGETRTLDLREYVVTSSGNPALLTRVESVTTAHGNGDPLVVDERTLVYTSAEGYYGKDSLTFEVTDGLTVDDPIGQVATLTIPITVLPSGNEPPTFKDSSAEVMAGGEPVGIDLSRLAFDPNADDVLTFSVAGDVAKGFEATVLGGVLSISAAKSMAKGTVTDIPVTVTDGKSDPVAGFVRVRVLSSTLPAPVANDDYVGDALPGVPIPVSVLANDQNPYPNDPLVIYSVEVEQGRGELLIEGDKVVVTPDDDFRGTMVVRYTVEDATKDPDRHASARIHLGVLKEPDAPTKPVLLSVEDRTVVLEWAAPPSNGTPIVGYTVTSDQGTTHSCAATICTLDGLSNDVEYRFAVVATNKVGDSAPSAPSEPARPDVRPDQPDAPTLVFGDHSLDVTWTPPATAGSAITRYTLELSPRPLSGSAQTLNLTSTHYTWAGLENGVAYQVRVQAYNDAPDPSTWSDYSASEVPAGPPDQVAKPTTTRLAPVGNRAQMSANWTVPPGNGDPVSSYTVSALRDGVSISSVVVPAGTLSQVFALDPSTSDYTFTVVARNKAGSSVTSPPSDPRRAFVAPGQPTGVSTVAGDHAITMSYTPGPRNGSDSAWVTYQYRLNGTGSWTAVPGNGVIGSLTNGSSYTVEVRATVTADGVTYDGNPSAPSVASVPYGPLPTPVVTAVNAGGTVQFSWPAPVSNGRPFTSMVYQIDGGAAVPVAAAAGSVNAPTGVGTHSIVITVTDSAGQTASASASATVPPPPPPPPPVISVNAYQGGQNTTYCSAAQNCYNLQGSISGFPGSSKLEYQCTFVIGGVDTKVGSSTKYVWTRADGTAQIVNGGADLKGGTSCYIGADAQNGGWTAPYKLRVQLPNGTWVTSNGVSW